WPDMSGTAPYAQGWPLSEFATGGNNRAWVRFYDGSQSAADSFLTSTFGADAHYPWDSTAVGAGVAYAVLTFQFDPQYFSGSIPSVKFVTPGCYWYDPRKDSTVGGSGSQVWSDETTWAPTNNPAVHLYNILRGISYGGKWMYGLQDMVAARLPLDSWFAAMNECDVAITQSDGSTLPQYQAGGEVSLDTKPADAVNALLTACAGRLSEVAGVYKLHVGAPGTAVLSFGDADIISTEAQTYTPFPSITSTINAITGKYPEPVSAWASTDAPPLYNPDYETADGNRELPQSVSYDMVPYKEQVQRLMKSALQEARRFRQATYVLPAWARRLEPGDFVSVTDTRNGFSTKLFRVDDLKYMSTLDVTVTLTEVDPSDYDWNPAADYTPVVPVPPTLVLPAAQLMTGWSAAPATAKDDSGNDRRPAIEVFYDGDLLDVRAVEVKVRLKSSGAEYFDGESPYGDPAANSATESVIISFASILPDTLYQISGKYLPYSGRATEWSDWIDVKTDKVLLGADDIYPISQSQVDQTVKDIQSFTQDGARAAIAAIQALEKLVADHAATGYDNTQQARVELTAATDYSVAKATDLFTVASNATSAVAQRVTTIEATLPGLATANALNALTTRVATDEGNITANSDAITQTNATVGKFSASGLFRAYSTAAVGTSSSTVALAATATAGAANPASAALYMLAMSDGTSQLALQAAQIMVLNGSTLTAMFQAGTTYINHEVVGLLESADGKMTVDFVNRFISISD
ncbi:MAG: phage tail protein, partial [Mesorhizobium sp.]